MRIMQHENRPRTVDLPRSDIDNKRIAEVIDVSVRTVQHTWKRERPDMKNKNCAESSLLWSIK